MTKAQRQKRIREINKEMRQKLQDAKDLLAERTELQAIDIELDRKNLERRVKKFNESVEVLHYNTADIYENLR